jgi:hypothetical protein
MRHEDVTPMIGIWPTIAQRLRDGLPVRRQMPSWGRLHVDRPLPFLVLYRRPDAPDEGTDALATTVASYLQTDASRDGREALRRALGTWAGTAAERFGSCLVVEVWSGSDVSRNEDGSVTRPGFVIHTRGEDELASTVDALAAHLSRVTLAKRRASVEVAKGSPHPPGRRPPLTAESARAYGCRFIGVEVTPAFREDGEVFPIVLRKFRRRMSRAMTQAFYEYISARTDLEPEHYFQVGRRSLVKAVMEMDERLTRIDDSFDLLLQATPVNGERAWREFRRSGFQNEPVSFTLVKGIG